MKITVDFCTVPFFVYKIASRDEFTEHFDLLLKKYP